MRIERVVVNASPLICLYRAGLDRLFAELWPNVTIPEAVWTEVLRGPEDDKAVRGLPKAGWARKIRVNAIPAIIMTWDLGAGESEVLAHAMHNPGYRAIVDDAQARRCARTLNIPVLGTASMLVLAKRRGLIASVITAVDSLKQSGLWISDDLIKILKDKAGE